MVDDLLPELLIAVVLLVTIAGIVVARRPRGEQRRDVAEREEQQLDRAPAGATVARPPVVERPTLRDRLGKSRRFLSARLSEAFGAGVDADTWDNLEAALIQADVGVETATMIVRDLKEKARERRVTSPADVTSLLIDELTALFDRDQDRSLSFAPEGVTVWLVMGVNGTGKTTTIGKLAADLFVHGKRVALAAADTFRAAADEQLEVWAERGQAEIVKHRQGADPGAVAYDALQHARAKGLDVLIVDTAGRLHTKSPLMDELAKIRRVLTKEATIQEGLLVIDATSGQNGLQQAREFADKAGVSGIVLTKLDGTAKGGIALTIERTLGIPIKLIGIGEGVEDLEPFDPKAYVQALLA